VCTVLLPPGVNIIAANKYVCLSIYIYIYIKQITRAMEDVAGGTAMWINGF